MEEVKGEQERTRWDRMISSINRTQQAAGWTPIRGPDREVQSADLGPADRKLFINQSGG